jgi:hypothetical protein
MEFFAHSKNLPKITEILAFDSLLTNEAEGQSSLPKTF